MRKALLDQCALFAAEAALALAGGDAGLMGEIGRTVKAGLGEEAVIGVIHSQLHPKEVC